MKKFALLAVILSAMYLHADAVFTLNTAGFNVNCGGPLGCGQVTLHQNGNSVDVSVTLTHAGSGFIETGSHTTFTFDLAGTPAVNIVFTSPGFHFDGSGTFTQAGFGDFTYGVSCNSSGSPLCGPGASNQVPPPLQFTVSKTVGSVLISDFIGNGNSPSSFFAADIFDGSVGLTGLVGATAPGTPTPEPSSLLLFGTGLSTAALFLKRRSKLSKQTEASCRT